MAATGAPAPKLFNDSVHGHIAIDALCVRIVDTPQFQRLRDLKQLGGCYRVFPTASHNRFEHSLGVSYLSGRMVDSIAENQPELCITEAEKLCVRIAGLCHDLGHGPLSHAFESTFLPRALQRKREQAPDPDANDEASAPKDPSRQAASSAVSSEACKPRLGPKGAWHHEWASVWMLEHLIKANGLMPHFSERGLDEVDVHFIQELILGDAADAPPGFQWRGRPHKPFLYDIVANKCNGIDTDKGDYFMRDAQMLGMKVGYDWGRMLRFARVAEFEGQLRVCFHEKEAWQLYELFHSRYTLHKRAYQHRVAKVVELMMIEALVLADSCISIPGEGGKFVRISDAVTDMDAYTRLTDTVFSAIALSPDPMLAQAQRLLERVDRRDLYKYIGQVVLPPPEGWLFPVTSRGRVDATAVTNELAQLALGSLEEPQELEQIQAHIIVDVMRLNYGKGSKNPMENVGFFSRISAAASSGSSVPSPTAAASSSSSSSVCESVRDASGPSAPCSGIRAFRIAKELVSALLPARFEENTLRVFCTSQQQPIIDACRVAFGKWVIRHTGERNHAASAASHALPAGVSSGAVSPSDAATAKGKRARPAASPKSTNIRSSPAEAGSAPATVYAPHPRSSAAIMSPIAEMNELASSGRKKRSREPAGAHAQSLSSSDPFASSQAMSAVNRRGNLGKAPRQMSMTQS